MSDDGGARDGRPSERARRRRRRRRGGERAGGDGAGGERAGNDQAGGERAGSDRSGNERAGNDRAGNDGAGERGGGGGGERSQAGQGRDAATRRRRERAGDRNRARPGERGRARRGDGDAPGAPAAGEAQGADADAQAQGAGDRRRRRRRRGAGKLADGDARRERRDPGEQRPARASRRAEGSAQRLRDELGIDDAPAATARQRPDRPDRRDRSSIAPRDEREGSPAGADAADELWDDVDAEPIFAPNPEDAPPGIDELVADLPPEPPADDPDPVTYEPDDVPWEPDPRELLDTQVRNVVGIKFHPMGRIFLYAGGERTYRRGDEVVVEAEHGVRTGTVAVASVRKPTGQRSLKRVLRRVTADDRAAGDRSLAQAAGALRGARALARELALPIKVYRGDLSPSGKKLVVYFTCESRVDFRDFVRRLSTQLRCRVEMRQTGVRDEAKSVGGIGSCGRELCCTTWLPSFMPVSIKMAKDQGLVLNPTKVSGQCGRLKCCLVYEQPIYAELRKGLPKLGKRVITDAGEGRVVEVDVLRQQVRVSLVSGEVGTYRAGEVQPAFPTQKPKPKKVGKRARKDRPGEADEADRAGEPGEPSEPGENVFADDPDDSAGLALPPELTAGGAGAAGDVPGARDGRADADDQPES